MKFSFASMILALFVASVLGKDRHCVFRVHAEANPNDGASFNSSIPALFSGKRVAIERIPRLSERDVVAFYPYSTSGGNYGALFQLDEHGRIYIASSLTKADIESMKKDWRLIGEKKKR